jgi:hypothetical protein
MPGGAPGECWRRVEHPHVDGKRTVVIARSICDAAIRGRTCFGSDCRVASASRNDNEPGLLFSSQRENALVGPRGNFDGTARCRGGILAAPRGAAGAAVWLPGHTRYERTGGQPPVEAAGPSKGRNSFLPQPLVVAKTTNNTQAGRMLWQTPRQAFFAAPRRKPGVVLSRPNRDFNPAGRLVYAGSGQPFGELADGLRKRAA